MVTVWGTWQNLFEPGEVQVKLFGDVTKYGYKCIVRLLRGVSRETEENPGVDDAIKGGRKIGEEDNDKDPGSGRRRANLGRCHQKAMMRKIRRWYLVCGGVHYIQSRGSNDKAYKCDAIRRSFR